MIIGTLLKTAKNLMDDGIEEMKSAFSTSNVNLGQEENIEKNNNADFDSLKNNICPHCGAEIGSLTSVCPHCGGQIPDAMENIKSFAASEGSTAGQWTDNAERRKSTDFGMNSAINGKCPHCGAEIDSLTTVCPYCGGRIEIDYADNGNASTAAMDLAEKIAEIEARPFVWKDDHEKSLSEYIFDKSDEAEARRRMAEAKFHEQKKNEIKSLITNYPIPNNSNGIISFMMLCCSHINTKDNVIDEMEEVWVQKAESVYQKARMILGTSQSFMKVRDLYEDKMREVNRVEDGIKNKNKYAMYLILAGAVPLLLGFLISMISEEVGGVFLVIGEFMMLAGGMWKMIIQSKKQK